METNNPAPKAIQLLLPCEAIFIETDKKQPLLIAALGFVPAIGSSILVDGKTYVIDSMYIDSDHTVPRLVFIVKYDSSFENAIGYLRMKSQLDPYPSTT